MLIRVPHIPCSLLVYPSQLRRVLAQLCVLMCGRVQVIRDLLAEPAPPPRGNEKVSPLGVPLPMCHQGYAPWVCSLVPSSVQTPLVQYHPSLRASCAWAGNPACRVGPEPLQGGTRAPAGWAHFTTMCVAGK